MIGTKYFKKVLQGHIIGFRASQSLQRDQYASSLVIEEIMVIEFQVGLPDEVVVHHVLQYAVADAMDDFELLSGLVSQGISSQPHYQIIKPSIAASSH